MSKQRPMEGGLNHPEWKGISPQEAYTEATRRISAGMMEGAYGELKKQYPDRVAKVNKELDDNFTVEGVEIWKKKIIKGMAAVGKWRVG